MSLIALVCHDTDDNKRSEYTRKTLISLSRTVDFSKHRLFVIDNGSCKETKEIIEGFFHSLKYWSNPDKHRLITNEENIGTANAINQAWRQREPGEHCIKIDNDVVIHSKGWVEEMEEAIAREPNLGQVGLKRKDCWEFPYHENSELRSKMIMLPHIAGERWIIVEQSKHIIGTCVMHSSALLDKVGYLWQPGLYGYDDVLMSWRANLAGFACVFLPHINIDHIDTGETEYQGWKERHSGQYSKQVSDIVDEYISGTKSLYYE